MHIFIAVIIALLVGSSASAQVLATAEPLGSGKQLLTVTENRLYDDGTELNIAYAMYVRGISDRIDFYLAVGQTRIMGEGQCWVGIGGNAKLFTAKGFSLSSFFVTSVPVHRHAEASTLLLNPALIVSRPVTSWLTLYSGANALIPVGNNRSEKLFTPLSNKFNIPIGGSAVWRSWSFTAEADLGKFKAMGIAAAKTF